MPRRTRLRAAVLRLALLLGGTAAGLGLAELGLRVRGDGQTFGGAHELTDFREGGRAVARVFTPDAELGYRPIMGGGAPYAETGTLVNGYPRERTAGVPRLLFLGDSVTARGQIVAGIARRGGVRREYWNAGVEGYDTVQEVRYYERYAAALHPDHVVLTFHNNDFEVTPVAFLDPEGRLVVFSPAHELGPSGRWLFRHSVLYRLVAGLRAAAAGDHAGKVAVTRESVRRLRDDLASDRIRFTVLLFPILKPYARWTEAERRSRRDSLAIFRELGLEVIDPFPALDEVVAASHGPGGDDPWHPTPEAGDRLAAYAVAHGLLEVGR